MSRKDCVLGEDFTIRGTMVAAARLLEECGVETAMLDARILVCFAGRVTEVDVVADPKRSLSRQQVALLESLVERRCEGEPIARILGYREFWSRRFYVGREALVPRPESELLVEAGLAWLKDFRAGVSACVVDLGSGSGCLLLSVLGDYGCVRGIGVDVSGVVSAVARYNAAVHGLEDRCLFVRGDFGDALGDGIADLVIANPPYIPTGVMGSLQREVRDYESHRSLDGGEDGLEGIRDVAEDAQRVLCEGGCFLLEIGAGQEERAMRILKDHGFDVTEEKDFLKDLSGRVRVIRGMKMGSCTRDEDQKMLGKKSLREYPAG